MKQSISKIQKGIGLIEVLVTTVVVAIGLLAVASMQGRFMESSGESKIRSEARVLAEQKIEELRNNISQTGYTAIPGSASPGTTVQDAGNPIAGTNASFTRTWTITNVNPFLPGSPSRKKISVVVGWDANGDGDTTDTDEKVNVVTEMAWIDPADSANYANENDPSGGTMAVPSPRQNASEDVASENVDANTPTPLPGTVTATLVNGALPSTITVTKDDGTTAQLTPITDATPPTHFYSTSFGNGIVAVYLCNDAGNCKYIQNHFGGVALRVAGTIYSTSGNGLDNITAAWTSSEIHACYNGSVTRNPSSGSLIYHSRPYECVFAGNCNATGDGVNHCYADSLVSDTQIDDKLVGPGGEYGDIGLLGVDDQGGNREQVCFLEDTVASTSPLLTHIASDPANNSDPIMNENYRFAVSKRLYVTRRIKHNSSLNINEQESEGINRSYTNHNFLIIARGTGASANQLCNVKAGSPNNISLAPREIVRTLNESGAANAVLTETTYTGNAGTAQTLTGNVTASRTKLRLYVPETGVCFLNNNNVSTDATAYACAVANNAPHLAGSAGVDIIGGSNEHPSATPAVFALCNKTDATTCNWLANFAAMGSTSNDCTAPWGSAVTNGDNVTAYQNELEPFGGACTSETRTCTAAVLSGTYLNQNCTVATTANCTAPWGGAITNGSSVTAFQTATVPTGQTCSSESRTCTSGILSGSFTNQSCAAQATRDITVSITPTGTGIVSDITITGTGATCTGTICTVAQNWTGTLTATGTCSGGGTVTGSATVSLDTATTAGITLSNCTGPVCTQLSGVSVSSGGSTPAYSATTVLAPDTCDSVKETRYCTNGYLSGTFSNANCTVTATTTVTGSLTAGSGSQTSDVTSIALGGVTCTSTYSCTVAGGSQTLSVSFSNPGTTPSKNAVCIGSTKSTASPATTNVTIAFGTTLPTIKAIKGDGSCP